MKVIMKKKVIKVGYKMSIISKNKVPAKELNKSESEKWKKLNYKRPGEIIIKYPIKTQ